jgi:hypothetical protein
MILTSPSSGNLLHFPVLTMCSSRVKLPYNLCFCFPRGILQYKFIRCLFFLPHGQSTGRRNGSIFTYTLSNGKNCHLLSIFVVCIPWSFASNNKKSRSLWWTTVPKDFVLISVVFILKIVVPFMGSQSLNESMTLINLTWLTPWTGRHQKTTF